jgi:hypothetical protein
LWDPVRNQVQSCNRVNRRFGGKYRHHFYRLKK